MAPTARFIWPMAMMTICDERDQHVDRDRASSSTWMLKRRQEGRAGTSAMTTMASRLTTSGAEPVLVEGACASIAPSDHPRGGRAGVRRTMSAARRRAAAAPRQARTQNSPTRSSSRPLVEMVTEDGAEQGAEHRDAAAGEQGAAEHRREEGGQQPVLAEMAGHRGNRRAGAGDRPSGRRPRRARPTACGRAMKTRPTRTPESSAARGLGAGGEHLAAEHGVAIEDDEQHTRRRREIEQQRRDRSRQHAQLAERRRPPAAARGRLRPG